MNTPEIQELLSRVEEEFKTLNITSKGLDKLAEAIEDKTKEHVSVSTLKRLWGYVGDKHEVRKGTMDIMARYVGFQNFDSFVQDLKKSPQYNSYFFSTNQIQSSELQAGDKIEIGWAPNRIVVLEYLGNESFKVVSNENSKLEPGDTFGVKDFMLGFPLYLATISRGGAQTPPYLAGRNGGLTLLQKMPPAQAPEGQCPAQR
jgi:hypothetical protein